MSTPPLRLFFALPCPLELAEAIAHWRDDLHLGGRPVAKENLHLTLAFLGSQPRGRVDELKSLAARLQEHAFTLHLNRLDHWKNGLLHLAPSQSPTALLVLAQHLRNALLEAGFNLESRPFHPHLTLARHCPVRHIEASPSFDWSATEFALFASENFAHGTHYRSLERWPLRLE